jgi:signal peptidase I
MASDEPYTVSGPNTPQTPQPANEWTPRPNDLAVTVPPVGEESEAVVTSTTRPTNRSGRAIREIVETLLLAAVIFVGVRLVVLNFRVDGHSMDPNLDNQEMLLVNRNAYVHFDLNNLRNLLPGKDHEGQDIVYPFAPPERGDIIVFNPPVPEADKPYIKRVIGLPGDHVTFQKGEVFVNGQQLDEPYIKEGITNCRREEYCDVTVPAGDIFALGDNRQNSSDSRVFGPVKVDAIIGKAWFAYWPMDDVGLVTHFDYPNTPER